MDNDTNFAEVFTNETFEGLKNAVVGFLKQSGSKNASLEFPDKVVYFHTHKDDVEIHIVSGKREMPEIPDDSLLED